MLIIFSTWHLLVGGMYQGANEHFVLKVDALEEGKMGKRENVSEFQKGQPLVARWLGQTICKNGAPVGCS